MGWDRRSGCGQVEWIEVEGVVEQDQQGHDDRLPDFNSIDSRNDVDAVRTEYADQCHISVVEPT